MTAFASAAIGAAALAVSELVAAVADAPPVMVDRRLASLWFGMSIRPVGWTLPSPWDPIAGDYRAADGWIRLHTNAPHHRAAALRCWARGGRALGRGGGRQRLAAEALKTAVVAAGGCAAAMRTVAEWAAHPQGRAVAAEPLIAHATKARRRAVRLAADRGAAAGRPQECST